jgi:biotin synthase
MNRNDLLQWLETTDPSRLEELYAEAYRIKREHVGTTVYFRGIIELSNICQKNCLYCGIRKGNNRVERYQMSIDEIAQTAYLADQMKYGSIVLQSGERQDEAFAQFIEEAIHKIKRVSEGRLGITLSLGEQSRETLQRWFKAGAHRYLLRIETSNESLYQKIHPDDHSFQERFACLSMLRQEGYQVGTGVMIGLPFQTLEDLADDILFFQKEAVDMIGMGPYIVHEDTPLAQEAKDFDGKKNLELGLKMIALTRILLKDVNIASTTALQSLSPEGRELGLKAGANIIMPNMTPTKYRKSYRLYDNKPCLDENALLCRGCLENRIDSIGEKIGYNQWGDSPHFLKRDRH